MSVISSDEARAYLNVDEADTAAVAEMVSFIGAAEVAIGKRVGPLEPETVTERHLGGAPAFALRKRPTIDVQSITPLGGDPLSLSSVDLDPKTGILELVSGGQFNARRYVIVYRAGWQSVPADLLIATKEMLRHMWRTQRKTGGAPRKADDDAVPGAAYALTYRVEQLIKPYLIGPF
jgi:hypothetical protein